MMWKRDPLGVSFVRHLLTRDRPTTNWVKENKKGKGKRRRTARKQSLETFQQRDMNKRLEMLTKWMMPAAVNQTEMKMEMSCASLVEIFSMRIIGQVHSGQSTRW